LTHDFSEADDLAAKYPDRLKKLQDEFWVQAKKFQVLPLDDRLAERTDPRLRPSLIEGRTRFTYYPGSIRVPESSAPPTKNASHDITAHIEVPQGGADGVLVAEGGVVGGFSLYIKDGRPVYEYNYFTQARSKVIGSEVLSPGPAAIRMEFRYDGGGIGKGATTTLFVNDKKVGEGRIEVTNWGRFSADETFDIGEDTGSPVSADYASPNRFTGILKKVEIDIKPANVNTADQEKIRSMAVRSRLMLE
jgi:hypothetical protein